MPKDREYYEEMHGKVWSANELQEDFIIHGFRKNFAIVTRKIDSINGTILFNNKSKIFFSFIEDK